MKRLRGSRMAIPSIWTIPFTGALAAILISIGVLFVVFDASLVHLVRQQPANVSAFFGTITDFGKTGWILSLAFLALAILFLADWRRLSTRAQLWFSALCFDLMFLIWSIAGSGVSASLIKNTIGRARPKWLDELGPHHFNFGAIQGDFASFPSGHSTTYGALAMVGILRFPRLWPLFAVMGILGGASRVSVGAHYPSDVIAGLLFGAMFVLLSARWLAERNGGFRVQNNGSVLPVRQLRLRPTGAGPSLVQELSGALK
ncbi:MAG: phosphatase PAP2 family protein [Pseudomonadota bacterium]